jgi:hypothetical protein
MRMNKILLALLLLCLIQVYGQDTNEVKYQFSKEVFKTKYKETYYESYNGEIDRLSKHELKFDDKVLRVYSNDTSLVAIFSKGIFYPEIIVGTETSKILTKSELDTMSTKRKVFYNLTRSDSLTIGNLEELEKLNPDFKTKRFLFWLFRIGFANPQECYFELRNENATKEMTISEFIENAKLTFYYSGTIII